MNKRDIEGRIKDEKGWMVETYLDGDVGCWDIRVQLKRISGQGYPCSTEDLRRLGTMQGLPPGAL